jgi:hypothetical protein
MIFQPFDFERTWWRLFQKHVVHIKFDTFVGQTKDYEIDICCLSTKHSVIKG